MSAIDVASLSAGDLKQLEYLRYSLIHGRGWHKQAWIGGKHLTAIARPYPKGKGTEIAILPESISFEDDHGYPSANDYLVCNALFALIDLIPPHLIHREVIRSLVEVVS